MLRRTFWASGHARGCPRGGRSTAKTSLFECALSTAQKQTWKPGIPSSARRESSRESVYGEDHETQVGRLAWGCPETVDPTRRHPLDGASSDWKRRNYKLSPEPRFDTLSHRHSATLLPRHTLSGHLVPHTFHPHHSGFRRRSRR